MKTLVTAYTFSAASKQIAFTDYTAIDLNRVLVITNVNTNTIIYNFAGNGMGGTVAGNVLTLDYNTTGMSDTDPLQIFYDTAALPATDVTIQDLYNQMALLLDRLEYGNITDVAKRLKVVPEQATAANLNATAVISSGTVTTVTTVTDVGSLDYLGISSGARVHAYRVGEAQLDAAFQLGIINNVTF